MMIESEIIIMAGKQQLSNSTLEQILLLNGQGKKNREIAKILNIHHRTVGDYLRKNGKQSPFANQPINQISDTEAICSKCNFPKPLKEFQFGRKGQKYEYRFSFCNECRKKQNYLNLNGDVNKFLADRFNRLKLRAKKNNIPCTITKEEFIEQYNMQNGLCFYTDEKMICEVGSELHRDSLSVDKIYPEKGYVKDNLVFTTHRINTCKNDLTLNEMEKWMPSWFERIKNKFLNNRKLLLDEQKDSLKKGLTLYEAQVGSSPKNVSKKLTVEDIDSRLESELKKLKK